MNYIEKYSSSVYNKIISFHSTNDMDENKYFQIKKEILASSDYDVYDLKQKYDNKELVAFIEYSLKKDKRYLKKNGDYLYKLYTIFRDITISDYNTSKYTDKETLKSSFSNSVFTSFGSLLNNAGFN